jgi:hypothetical protein
VNFRKAESVANYSVVKRDHRTEIRPAGLDSRRRERLFLSLRSGDLLVRFSCFGDQAQESHTGQLQPDAIRFGARLGLPITVNSTAEHCFVVEMIRSRGAI